jgi:transcriptional regulator with XRE-family HTH domain
MKTVAERLRSARQRNVWSQADLSKRSTVPVVTISRIENNRFGPPKPSTVRKLAEALDVDPAWLLYGLWVIRGQRSSQDREDHH